MSYRGDLFCWVARWTVPSWVKGRSVFTTQAPRSGMRLSEYRLSRCSTHCNQSDAFVHAAGFRYNFFFFNLWGGEAGSCHWLYDGTGQFDRLVCWSAPGSLVLVSVTFSAAQYRQSSNWCTQRTPEQMIDWSMWITCHQAWSICFNEHPMPEQAQTQSFFCLFSIKRERDRHTNNASWRDCKKAGI